MVRLVQPEKRQKNWLDFWKAIQLRVISTYQRSHIFYFRRHVLSLFLNLASKSTKKKPANLLQLYYRNDIFLLEGVARLSSLLFSQHSCSTSPHTKLALPIDIKWLICHFSIFFQFNVFFCVVAYRRISIVYSGHFECRFVCWSPSTHNRTRW